MSGLRQTFAVVATLAVVGLAFMALRGSPNARWSSEPAQPGAAVELASPDASAPCASVALTGAAKADPACTALRAPAPVIPESDVPAALPITALIAVLGAYAAGRHTASKETRT
jgi:hypothetical protein